MTFKEKIDKILQVNKLGINSVSALEDKIDAGRGAINEFYNQNREPGRKTLKKIKSLAGLNEAWYDTGKGEVFGEKGTYVETATDNKEINTEKMYRDLVEANTAYRLVPKTILDEEYRIILKSELEERSALWREALDAKNKVIDQLEKEIAELRGKRVHAK